MPGDCITYDAYQALCVRSNEKDSGNQEVLIDFLNDLGSVLHFRDTHLFDLGVLKPEWVTQGIYGLLNADILKAANGVLYSTQLALLLDPARYPRQRHRYLLALMQKFELCFEMPHTAGKQYLIAELLPKKTPELPEWKRADVLRFEYHYNIFPEGLVPRFIVRTHTLSEGGERWRHGVELHQGEARALVRADVQGKCIYIATRGPGRQPRDLLAVIRREFEEIHGGIKGLTANERVPVPDYPAVKLDYRKLLIREASGKTTVEFETETESLEMPLRKLLDNFEDISSRKERVQFIVQPGGILNYMTEEKFDFSHSRFTNSVVGAHMANITNAIQQLPPERGDVRGALEELKKHAESLLKELPPEKQEEAVQNLDDFVKEAAKQTPRKPFFEVTSKGLIDAALTVAAISGPIIATVEKLRPLLGF
jgi:GTPase SAR1 family protein